MGDYCCYISSPNIKTLSMKLDEILALFNENLTPLFSQQELVAISQEISQHYAVEAVAKEVVQEDKPLNSDELLEISQNISLYYAPVIPLDSNRVVALQIDPKTLYVYWSFDDSFGDSNSNQMQSEKQLILRVYSHSIHEDEQECVVPIFETDIYNKQFQQKINLPETDTSARYTAYIGFTDVEKKFSVWLDSNHIHIAKKGCEGTENYFFDESYESIKEAKIDEYKENMLKNTSSTHFSHYASTIMSGQSNKK